MGTGEAEGTGGRGNWGGNWGGNRGGGWYGSRGTGINNNYCGPGWSGANWGNWYHGGAGNFWAGFGAGALTSWGVNALFRPTYAYSSLGYYPAAWSAPVYGSWGLESVATDWMYSGYYNPYVTPATQIVVVQQPVAVPVGGGVAPPAQQVVAYDYANPINVAAAAPEPTAAESAQKVFESARDSFKAGDYGRALALADQALAMLPDDPVLHEFRGLALFAPEAVRRGRGGRVRRALGRAGLGLGHPGGPLPERGRLHRPPPGPGGVRQAEPDRGGAPVPARLLVPRAGEQGGGRRQVRQGGAAPAAGQALGQARRGAGPRRQAARPARRRRHDGPRTRDRPRRRGPAGPARGDWRVPGSPNPTPRSRSRWPSSPRAPSPGP